MGHSVIFDYFSPFSLSLEIVLCLVVAAIRGVR